MCTPGVKLGLYLPATLHDRMVAAAGGKPRGALQAAYGEAFRRLLDGVAGRRRCRLRGGPGPEGPRDRPSIPGASAIDSARPWTA